MLTTRSRIGAFGDIMLNCHAISKVSVIVERSARPASYAVMWTGVTQYAGIRRVVT